jgi:hypothetical protein
LPDFGVTLTGAGVACACLDAEAAASAEPSDNDCAHFCPQSTFACGRDGAFAVYSTPLAAQTVACQDECLQCARARALASDGLTWSAPGSRSAATPPSL